MTPRCVIVGAGHGAAQLCASLRRAKYAGTITVIGDEVHPPYHRPPLSKTQLDPAGDASLQLIRPLAFYAENDIELLCGSRVEAIDVEQKVVQVGAQQLPYDKLVLCTGSSHRSPPITGLDLEGVFALRTADEAEALRGAAGVARRAVIIGGGFIGLEVAASLRKLGLAVTVVEFAPRVLSRVAAPEVSQYFEALHCSEGVEVITGLSVREINKRETGLRVVSACGKTFDTDVVVLGAGADADSALAEAAGLDVKDGVVVNESGQTSNNHIHALGDCCNQFHPMYERRLRLESVQNAVDQAKVVAAHLCGDPLPTPALPWFWSDQYDTKLQIAGVSTGYDAVMVRGTPEPGASFSVWYFKAGWLLAVDAINDSMAYAVGTKMLKNGWSPRPADLQDTELDLKEVMKRAKEENDA